MFTTHRAVACTVCVCDDLVVDMASDGHITPRSGACCLAKPWFNSLIAAHPAHTTVNDNPVSLVDHLWATIDTTALPDHTTLTTSQ